MRPCRPNRGGDAASRRGTRAVLAGAVRWSTNTRQEVEVVGPEAFTSFAVLLGRP